MNKRLTAATVLAAWCAAVLADAPAPSDEDTQLTGAPYLEFESVIDGNCHNLSEGGKLRKMRNTHDSATIRYRLIRYFADVPQWGRAHGVIKPEDGEIKLGCTKVDGREQRWEIERAEILSGDS